VKKEFWHDPDDYKELEEDLQSTLARYDRRGVVTLDQKLEAYLTEHRSSQYIDMQMMSSRWALDVITPFGDQDLIGMSSQIRWQRKVHYTINREILRRQAPSLLDHPTASVWLPASFPIWMQEATRLLRKKADQAKWSLYRSSHGRLCRKTSGWANFEVLRNTQVLDALVEDLRCDLWNREHMANVLEGARRFTHAHSMHEISDALLTVYTVDLMLR
jgi:hypothetical protein